MNYKIKTPILPCKVTPIVLYPPKLNRASQSTKVLKIYSPFEYLHYMKRRLDYQEKQMEMIETLQVDQENFEKLTYSIKQVGMNQGKFGIQSQRKFLISQMETSRPTEQQEPFLSSERISYQFKSKRLATSRRDNRVRPPSGFFTMPEKPATQQRQRSTVIERIVKKSRQRKRHTVSQPPMDIVFKHHLPKFNSYSRLLSEMNTEKATQLFHA